MSAPRAPETEAGRALLNWSDGATDYHAAVCLALQGESCSCELPDAILAIEAEVRASLAAKVRALPGVSIGEGIYPEYVRREYVLTLIEGSDPASPEAKDET